MLRHNRLSVCQIASVLNVAVSTTSNYLTELRRAGLVTEQRQGRWVYYRLTDEDSSGALLRLVLVLLHPDPQVQRDAREAGRLNGTAPDPLCARLRADGPSARAAGLDE